MGKRVITVNGRRGHRITTCRSGAAATEFAFILPPLLFLMFGTFQTGMLMYSYNEMVGSARDTARAMAVCSIVDASEATAHAKLSLPKWVADDKWTITPSFGDDVSMTISVDPKSAAILSYIPFNFPALTTSVTMRKDPKQLGSGYCV